MSIIKTLLTERTDEKKELFHKNVAMVQRGRPEQIMLKAQKIMGGGVMQWAVEHIGDITHRMAEEVTFETAGYEFVKPKVERAVRLLSSGYGFEREFKENIKNNASFHNRDEDEFMRDVKQVLSEYSRAHSKIDVYNRMQWLARESAVELGNMNFDKTLSYLKELKENLDKGVEHWIEVAHKIDMGKWV